jgi:hypothetical protein
MAIYNVVKHAIETDAGEGLADLSKLVTIPEAWDIADSWTEHTSERRRLREAVRIAEASLIEERAQRELIEIDLGRTEELLEEAEVKISRLEVELMNLKAEAFV